MPLPKAAHLAGEKVRDSLLRRKYVIPFLLACVILFCNTATGINSIVGYNTNILLQSGLSDVEAHWGYVVFTLVNFLMTIGGVMLVDRKGRKFLLILGTAGIIVSLGATGALFHHTEKLHFDTRDARSIDGQSGPDTHAAFRSAEANTLLAAQGYCRQRHRQPAAPL